MPARTDDVVRGIFRGVQQVVTHSGISQYQAGGSSSCGLAALNCARVILTKEKEGLSGEALLNELVKEEMAQEITSICAQWSSNAHLDIEDVMKAPIFDQSLALVGSKFDRPTYKQFKHLLLDLQSASKNSAAVVITRPPEIVACVKLRLPSRADVFMVFDSHPRQDHPDGAGFVFSTSISATATYLSTLLDVDSRLLQDSTLQWEAQLLGSFSGHIFVAKEHSSIMPADVVQTVLDSSLVILTLQAEVANLRDRNSSLTTENRLLETQLEESEEACREAQKKYKTLVSARSARTDQEGFDQQTVGLPQRVVGPSKHRNGDNYSSTDYNGESHTSPAYHTYREFESDVPRSSYSAVAGSSRDTKPPSVKGKEKYSSLERVAPRALGWDHSADALQAAEKQRQFEEEDRQLRAERKVLEETAQAIFDCCLCIDQYPEDYVARIIPCGHPFCRTCIRTYIITQLDNPQPQFPIICPICKIDNDAKIPSIISNKLLQDLGVPEKDYQRFEVLQNSNICIQLSCPKCQRSAPVVRQEYEQTRIIACPFPGCNYVWCKACNQTIVFPGPEHSCDGSSELDHLMKQHGWKHCPGCKTPVSRTSGCNHMTCMSPGCNTHFCYRCGDLIIQSQSKREASRAVTSHYQRCSLIDDILDRAVPP